MATETPNTSARIAALLAKQPKRWAHADVVELEALYRAGHRELAHARSAGPATEGARELERELIRARGLLGREPSTWGAQLRGIWTLIAVTAPRVLRAEWRLVLGSFVLFYGLSALAFALVAQDRDNAYILFDRGAIETEIEQLEALAPGEAFRGNFTFDEDESTATSALIITNNVRVTFLFLALALVPPLFVLVLLTNAFMLGTYFAIAADYDQFGSLASVLMCHGTLELQAIVLAGCAGVVMVRGLIAPGIWTRAESIRRGTQRALAIFTPAVGMLLIAGFIEGYVTAHVSFAARIAFIVASALLLIVWFALGGRHAETPLP